MPQNREKGFNLIEAGLRMQWSKYHRTQGNAVPVPPAIEIQRLCTSYLIKVLGNPQPPVGAKTDVQFPHL